MTLAIAWMARTERDFRTAVTVFIASGVAVAAVVLYNQAEGISLVQGTRVAIGRDIVDETGARIDAILTDPNDLALILLFPLAFALGRIVYRRSILDLVFSIAGVGIIIAAIVATQSRGAIIGVIAVVGTFLYSRFRSKSVAIVAVLIAGVALVGAMKIADRHTGGLVDLTEGGVDELSQDRLEAWETAFKMARMHPLTGVGIGNFGSLYFGYTDFWAGREMATHSMWFQLLAETGFIGFGLFVAMIVASFVANLRTLNRLAVMNAPATLRATCIGLHGALAGTCAAGTFLSQAYTWPVYVTVGLIAALTSATSPRDSTPSSKVDWTSTVRDPEN